MVRRLSVAFVFFGVLSASFAAHAVQMNIAKCMFNCGALTTADLETCKAICGA